METVIATVLNITGEVWARDENGNLRQLEAGDKLYADEVLVTAANGNAILDFGGGTPPIEVPGGQEIAMAPELAQAADDDSDQASDTNVLDQDVQDIIAALNAQDGSQPNNDAAPAAGNQGGAAADAGGGHDFVVLSRIASQVSPLNYDFPLPSQIGTPAVPQFLAAATGDNNGTPTVGTPEDVSVISIKPFDDTVYEGDSLQYVVTLNRAPDTLTIFTFQLGGGSASPNDYGSPSFSDGVRYGSVEVPPGVKQFTMTLPTIDDTVDEPTEIVPLVIDGVEATGTILDNDTPTITVDDNTPDDATNDITIPEGDDGTFTVNVGDAAAGSTLDLSLSNGSATTPADYDGSFQYSTDNGSTWTTYGGAITIGAGDETVLVKVSTNDDSVDEPNETFDLNATLHSNGADYDAKGTATITDNDAAPGISIGAGTATVSEEGLSPLGIEDGTGNDPDISGTDNDTTNATSDDGSFSVTGSNPLTVEFEDPDGSNDNTGLQLTSGGEDINWTVSADGHTLTGYTGNSAGAGNDVIRITMTEDSNNPGQYDHVVDLLGPVDHPDQGYEDVLSFVVGIKVSDGVNTPATGQLTVNVEDDSPDTQIVTRQVEAADQVDTNILLVLDTSGSMDEGGSPSRMEIMKDAVNQLLDTYDNLGDVRVQIVSFDSNAGTLTTGWMSVADVADIIDDLAAGGNTNYDAALEQVIDSIDFSDSTLSGAQNVAYFLSDGEPNRGESDWYDHNSDDGIQSDEEQAWQDYLEANNVHSYAIGVGSNVSTNSLTPIGYNGVDGTDSSDNIQVVENPGADLSNVLQGTVTIHTVQGSLFTDGGGSTVGGFGADGPGYVESVTINGVKYTYDPDTGTVSDDDSTVDPSDYQFDSGTGVLTVTTDLGGTFELNMQDASYEYSPGIAQTGDDTVSYTVVDADGDGATADLVFDVVSSDLIVEPNSDNTVSSQDGNDIIVGDTGGVETTVTLGGDYNISLVVDTSGSMTNDQIVLIQASLKNLVDQLAAHHGTVTVQLVPFSDYSKFDSANDIFTLTADGTKNSSAVTALKNAIDGFDDNGGTNYEDAFNDATNWFTGLNNSATNLTFFLTDGKPTYYMDDGGDRQGDGNTTTATVFQQSIDAFAQLSANSTVHAIGIGNGISEEYLKFFDNTDTSPTNGSVNIGGDEVTGPIGDVEIINNASELDAVLAHGSTDTGPATVGDDTLDGGDGNDILFGDTINTDGLVWTDPGQSGNVPNGSGGIEELTVFLTAQNGQAPSDAELYDYIEANHQSLNVAGDTRGGNDILNGGGGDDIIYGQGGDDSLTGGAGDDILSGGVGADSFAWALGDEGTDGSPAQDTVTDFSAADGDKLDLSDLLQGEENATDLGAYLHFSADGSGGTLIHVSSDGGYGNSGDYDASQTDQTIQVQNVDLNGLGSNDHDIANTMLNNGSLDIDQ